MSENIELKPCPFCAASDLSVAYTKTVFQNYTQSMYYTVKIKCRKCGANVSGVDAWAECDAFRFAVEAWNIRTEAWRRCPTRPRREAGNDNL